MATDEKTPAEATADLVDGGEVEAAPAAQQVVTETTPSKDDESPAVFGDARPDDGVVRTNSAVVPIADALVAGAGQHVPAPTVVDGDGREVFPDGVAPTARVDYDGPNAPAEQGGDAATEKQAAKPKASEAKKGE